MLKLFTAAAIVTVSTFSATTFAGTKVTKCGEVRLERYAIDRMTTGIRKVLTYKLGPMLPAQMNYILTGINSKGKSIQKSWDLVQSINHGESFCVTGESYQDADYANFLRPTQIEQR